MFKVKYINNINNSSISNSIKIKYSHTNKFIENNILNISESNICLDKYLKNSNIKERYLSNKYLHMYEYGKLCYKESIIKSNKINLQKIREDK
jgi:hypothetical protein